MADEAPSRSDFEHLSRAVDKLTTTIEKLPDLMAAIYVRQDVYNAHQQVHAQTHAEQREDIDSLNGWKDMVLKIVVSTIVVGILGLLIGTGAVRF